MTIRFERVGLFGHGRGRERPGDPPRRDHGGDGYIAEIEILRGDLAEVLYDDTRDTVEYRFGDRIAELKPDADGVEVTFAGGSRRRFDLVIGASGK